MKWIFVFLLLGVTLTVNAQLSNKHNLAGKPLPNIQLEDTAGKSQSLLKMLDNRYTIIDFWASWCLPCKSAHKHTKNVAAQFKDVILANGKSLNIIFISVDQHLEAWKQAIATDSLNQFTHLVDTKVFEGAVGQELGIGYLPQCMLVAPDGKVIKQYTDIRFAVDTLEKLQKIIE